MISCPSRCYLCKMGCYQHPRWCYHHTEGRYWILIHNFPCLDGKMRGSAAKASPSVVYSGLNWAFCFMVPSRAPPPLSTPPRPPQARVITVPAHAVCFNENRKGRWLRVNYSLMLESNTISPFITLQRHGLTGSHQLVKGTRVEGGSVLCEADDRGEKLQEDFFYLSITAWHSVMSQKRTVLFCTVCHYTRTLYKETLCLNLLWNGLYQNFITCFYFTDLNKCFFWT